MRNLYSFLLLLLLANTGYSQFIFNKIEINPGPAGSNPFAFDTLNGKMIFIAATDTAGHELYTSDGTQAGTTLLKNINPGSGGISSPNDNWKRVILDGSKYFFYGDDGLAGLKLWMTNGTTAGTQMITDSKSLLGYPNALYTIGAYKGAVYFSASANSDYYLWKSDGTPAGTREFKQIRGASSFTNYNGKLYFIASDYSFKNRELWVTDSSSGGTMMLKDINPGDGNAFSNNQQLIEYKGQLFFWADDGLHGYELWTTDGTATGTVMVKDIWQGLGNSRFVQDFTVFNNKLYFAANDSVHGIELWESDGTTAGTKMVKDIYPGIRSSKPYNIRLCNNKLYFSAMDTFNHGEETWISDGTAAGTRMLKEIAPDTLSGAGTGFTAYKNHVFFQAPDSTASIYQSRLWITDGTGTNTHSIAPIGATVDSALYSQWYSSFNESFVYRGALYFAANFDGTGMELWSLKDTTGASNISITTQKLFSVYPNPNNGTFTLQLANTNFRNSSINVYDMAGKIVYQQKDIQQMQIHTLKIDTPKGNYLLMVQLDDVVQTKQIVIE